VFSGIEYVHTPNDSEIFLPRSKCVSLLMVQKLRLLGTWADVLLDIQPI